MPIDMEFENKIMRIIFTHCDKQNIQIKPDEAWDLAKKISAVSKPKLRKDLKFKYYEK